MINFQGRFEVVAKCQLPTSDEIRLVTNPYFIALFIFCNLALSRLLDNDHH